MEYSTRAVQTAMICPSLELIRTTEHRAHTSPHRHAHGPPFCPKWWLLSFAFSSSFSFCKAPNLHKPWKWINQARRKRQIHPVKAKTPPMRTRSLGPAVRLGCQRAETDWVARSHLFPVSGVPLYPPPPLFPSLPTVNCWEGCFCVLSASLFPCSGVLSHTFSFSLGWFNLTPWALVTRWGAEQPQRNSLGSTLQGPLSVR